MDKQAQVPPTAHGSRGPVGGGVSSPVCGLRAGGAGLTDTEAGGVGPAGRRRALRPH